MNHAFSRERVIKVVRQKIFGFFGFIERETKKFFAEVVDKRDANTLIPIIEKRINPNTKLLVTDEWRSYLGLSKKNFSHKTIKHKKHFVDPKTLKSILNISKTDRSNQGYDAKKR